ncbi:toxin [Cytobacillus sp. Hz8]|uniref:anthrax toxin lethal factor-related metalloendopeptidase n=1 Tax=Cytobacillus sp. Hz8 TaxID=3347168 RepID=UPI0035D58F9B
MRKFIVFVVLVVFSFLMMEKSQATSTDIYLGELGKQSELKSFLHLQSSRILDNIIIVPRENYDMKAAAGIISRIDRLPTSLLQKINDQNIVIKLFTGKLTDNPTASHLKGKTPRGYTSGRTWDSVPGIGGSKTVLVKIGASEKGNGHGSVNLELHELAHSIDRYVYHNLRSHPSYLKIWNEEKYELFPNQTYFLSFPEEYFAESFAYYYMGGEYHAELKEKAPKTYELIKGLK